MTSYSSLAILLNGAVKNVNLSTHELVLGSIKVGGASGTALDKTALDSLISNSHASGSDNQNVTAGDGLTGGGSGASPSLAVGAGNGISVSADAVAVKLDGTTLSVSGDGLKLGTVTTDMVSESGTPTNKYFTDTRAKTAAVVNTTAGSETDQAASVSAMKSYVTDQVAAGGTAAEWQTSVLTRATTPPGSPATGARYLIKATATDAWEGKEDQIAQWSGTAWVYTTCTTGTFVSADDETDGIYYYGGSSWTKKQWENTTASTGLQKVGVDIRAKVDGTSISYDSTLDALRAKATVVVMTANQGITPGRVVAINAAGTGVLKSVADTAASAKVVGVCIADTGTDEPCYIATSGVVGVLATAGARGDIAYLDTSATYDGVVTNVAPNASGNVVFKLGYFLSSNTIFLQPQYLYEEA